MISQYLSRLSAEMLTHTECDDACSHRWTDKELRSEILTLIRMNEVLLEALEESIKYASELSGFRGENPGRAALQRVEEMVKE